MNRLTTSEFISVKTPSYSVIWGNKHFKLDEYIKNSKISSVGACNQFHSNIISESFTNATPRCDAIFTHKKNHALIIKTADCVPILVKHDKFIFAIHAGWRGICDEIILNLKSFKPNHTTQAFIGPHISKNSYEVGAEVIQAIISKNKKLDKLKNRFSIPKNGKFLLNLKYLAIYQLIQTGVSSENIYYEDIDTLTTKDWNSYRRDSSSSGRNLSLIVQH